METLSIVARRARGPPPEGTLGPRCATTTEATIDLGIAAAALVVMVVGLAGTVLPGLPGLPIVLGAALVSLAVHGMTTGTWVAAVVLVLLAAAGVAAKYVLPSRRGRGVPRRSLVTAAAGGVVGFFVLPVLGFVVGALAALAVAEHRRLGDWDAARRSVATTARAVGLGMLLEVVAGVAMVVVWLATVVLIA